MNTIPLQRTSNRYPVNVTGAALRAVQQAEQHADAILAVADAAYACLAGHYCDEQTPRDATWMANAAGNLARWNEAATAVISLKGRYSTNIYPNRAWPGSSWQYDPSEYFRILTERLLNQLRDAGVPMPSGDVHTEQYWRDAAARGC